MYIKLNLWEVPQHKIGMITHEIKAIAPRLEIKPSSSSIIAIGYAVEDEISEAMCFIKSHHTGRCSLEKSNQPY